MQLNVKKPPTIKLRLICGVLFFLFIYFCKVLRSIFLSTIKKRRIRRKEKRIMVFISVTIDISDISDQVMISI